MNICDDQYLNSLLYKNSCGRNVLNSNISSIYQFLLGLEKHSNVDNYFYLTIKFLNYRIKIGGIIKINNNNSQAHVTSTVWPAIGKKHTHTHMRNVHVRTLYKCTFTRLIKLIFQRFLFDQTITIFFVNFEISKIKIKSSLGSCEVPNQK